MIARSAKTGDAEKIAEMHSGSHYGFELPEELYGVQIIEEDGQILAAAGYELAAQVMAVLNPEILSPIRRIRALQMLHKALAPEILGINVKSVYSFCDPRFHGFDRRMMKMGWSRKLWPCLFLEREEIKKVFG